MVLGLRKYDEVRTVTRRLEVELNNNKDKKKHFLKKRHKCVSIKGHYKNKL